MCDLYSNVFMSTCLRVAVLKLLDFLSACHRSGVDH